LLFLICFVFYSRADKRRTRVAGRNTSEKDATFTRDTGMCMSLYQAKAFFGEYHFCTMAFSAFTATND